jgi:hypothetical protein
VKILFAINSQEEEIPKFIFKIRKELFQSNIYYFYLKYIFQGSIHFEAAVSFTLNVANEKKEHANIFMEGKKSY